MVTCGLVASETRNNQQMCGFELDPFAFVNQMTDNSDDPCPNDITPLLDGITMNEYASHDTDIPILILLLNCQQRNVP